MLLRTSLLSAISLETYVTFIWIIKNIKHACMMNLRSRNLCQSKFYGLHHWTLICTCIHFSIFDCITCEHCDTIMNVCQRFQLSFQHLRIWEGHIDDWKGDLNSMGNNEWGYIIISRYILNFNPQMVLQNTKDTNSREGMWNGVNMN
jgi:hypothetical protein